VNVNQDRRVRDFFARYARWSVLQRKLVGGPAYSAQLFLNPVLLALAALSAAPGGNALLAFLTVCAAKIALDGAAARTLRDGGFPLRQLLLVPAKDLVFGAALLVGFLTDEVEWRGHRLRVLRGTYLASPRDQGAAEVAAEV
jgi:ceramide glucosyltransferase